MLILPLHRPLTRANFPYVTALLILVNVLVYFGWQLGDEQVLENAVGYYQSSGLARYEFPAYERWQTEHPRRPAASGEEDGFDTPEVRTLAALQSDNAFLQALRNEQLITPTDPDYSAWRPLRSEFDRLWQLSFTERHLMRYSEFDLGRMFSSMFMHGGVGHLFGNMLFLALLGLLVEGALGSRYFLLLYLLGGMGGQLASLAWRWGDAGGGLGASGAIAALMGAYCVLWGRRKVRVFYWFFVVFDFVSVPALLLLPFWLGWQVLSLLLNKGEQVSFDAHAGGIICGAALAWLAVQAKLSRPAFLDAEESTAANADGDYRRAMDHLGKLEIAPAKALLSPLLQSPAPPLPYLLAWYRCCRYESGMPVLPEAARRVLSYPGVDIGSRREILAAYRDFVATGRAGLADQDLLSLAKRWLQAGAAEDAEPLLRDIGFRKEPAGLPEAWLQLANTYRDQRGFGRFRQICQEISEQLPGTTAAQKAAFLLAAETG